MEVVYPKTTIADVLFLIADTTMIVDVKSQHTIHIITIADVKYQHTITTVAVKHMIHVMTAVDAMTGLNHAAADKYYSLLSVTESSFFVKTNSTLTLQII